MTHIHSLLESSCIFGIHFHLKLRFKHRPYFSR
ncbi:unnamed protein product [Acanthoscelides obtectus]|uniref:Uncharacterized protein n=1 Tax=Acanthoscelides obtectus TaxID=200917 RepID=A0A9P0JV36_ACAOB|nr:unnamed protein product [Acanthoscelides obtectus]CAK1640841.1 hypothetical protein AOBTE_LOCUS11958 [Acanthoscelides obtectus]